MRLGSIATACLAAGLTLLAGAGIAQAQAPLERIRLSMHFNVPQLSWYGLYWADEKGYFKDAGLEISFQYLRGSPLAVQATGAGQSEMGIASADTALSGGIQKLPIKVVANHLQKDSTGVIVNKAKGGAADFRDLGGKTIVTSDATTLAPLLRAALKRSDMTDKVTVLSVDPQSVCTLMLADRADGCTGFQFAHLLQVKARGVDADFVPFSSDAFPILGHVIMANTDFLAAKGDAVRAFLKAAARGYAEASADIPATVEMMARIDPTQPRATLPDAIAIIASLTVSPRSQANGFGWMDDAAWSNLYAGLVEGGVLQPGYNIPDLYTNAYLPGKN